MRTRGYHPKALRVDSLGLTEKDLREARRMGYITQRIKVGRYMGKRILVKAPPPPKFCDTNLESAVEEILNNLGYMKGRDYEKQYPAYCYTLDFAFPRLKLGIEPGARHWHNNSEHSFEPEKDENLRKEGWEVLWYDENDLNDKERVKEEIRRKINNMDYIL